MRTVSDSTIGGGRWAVFPTRERESSERESKAQLTSGNNECILGKKRERESEGQREAVGGLPLTALAEVLLGPDVERDERTRLGKLEILDEADVLEEGALQAEDADGVGAGRWRGHGGAGGMGVSVVGG